MKIELPPDEFARVCYLVLMQNGEGLIDKHPSYIKDKLWLLEAGYDAFYSLDIYNMRKVVAWCDEWHIYVPKQQMEYLKLAEEARAELIERGVDIP